MWWPCAFHAALFAPAFFLLPFLAKISGSSAQRFSDATERSACQLVRNCTDLRGKSVSACRPRLGAKRYFVLELSRSGADTRLLTSRSGGPPIKSDTKGNHSATARRRTYSDPPPTPFCSTWQVCETLGVSADAVVAGLAADNMVSNRSKYCYLLFWRPCMRVPHILWCERCAIFTVGRFELVNVTSLTTRATQSIHSICRATLHIYSTWKRKTAYNKK